MNRIKYIDYAKGIGILVIMFVHSIQPFRLGGVYKYPASFHVPIFFIAAGCLAYYQREKTLPFVVWLKKRAKALLVAYVVFSIINSALKLGVLFVTHSVTKAAIKDEMIALFITGNGTVWFLLTLFGAELIYWIVKRFLPRCNVTYIICAVVGLTIPFLMISVYKNPFATVIIRIVAGFGYYCFGYLLAQCLKPMKKNSTLCFSLAMFLVGTVSFYVFGCDYGFSYAKFANPLGSLMSSIFISSGLICFFVWLERIDFKGKVADIMTYFGKNSLVAMLVHPTIILAITYPLGHFIDGMGYSRRLICSLVVWIVVVALEVPCIFIINRYFPWMIGKSKERKNG